jgi:hypothetical protein
MQERALGVQFEGPAERGVGFVAAMLEVQHAAQVTVRYCELRVDRNGGTEFGNGLVRLPLLNEDTSQAVNADWRLSGRAR